MVSLLTPPNIYRIEPARDLERDLRCFKQRLGSAQFAAIATSTEKVQIGNRVTCTDEHDTELRVQLVDEDQADAAHGLINWGSPLGIR